MREVRQQCEQRCGHASLACRFGIKATGEAPRRRLRGRGIGPWVRRRRGPATPSERLNLLASIDHTPSSTYLLRRRCSHCSRRVRLRTSLSARHRRWWVGSPLDWSSRNCSRLICTSRPVRRPSVMRRARELRRDRRPADHEQHQDCCSPNQHWLLLLPWKELMGAAALLACIGCRATQETAPRGPGQPRFRPAFTALSSARPARCKEDAREPTLRD